MSSLKSPSSSPARQVQPFLVARSAAEGTFTISPKIRADRQPHLPLPAADLPGTTLGGVVLRQSFVGTTTGQDGRPKNLFQIIGEKHGVTGIITTIATSKACLDNTDFSSSYLKGLVLRFAAQTKKTGSGFLAPVPARLGLPQPPMDLASARLNGILLTQAFLGVTEEIVPKNRFQISANGTPIAEVATSKAQLTARDFASPYMAKQVALHKARKKVDWANPFGSVKTPQIAQPSLVTAGTKGAFGRDSVSAPVPFNSVNAVPTYANINASINAERQRQETGLRQSDTQLVSARQALKNAHLNLQAQKTQTSFETVLAQYDGARNALNTALKEAKQAIQAVNGRGLFTDLVAQLHITIQNAETVLAYHMPMPPHILKLDEAAQNYRSNPSKANQQRYLAARDQAQTLLNKAGPFPRHPEMAAALQNAITRNAAVLPGETFTAGVVKGVQEFIPNILQHIPHVKNIPVVQQASRSVKQQFEGNGASQYNISPNNPHYQRGQTTGSVAAGVVVGDMALSKALPLVSKLKVFNNSFEAANNAARTSRLGQWEDKANAAKNAIEASRKVTKPTIVRQAITKAQDAVTKVETGISTKIAPVIQKVSVKSSGVVENIVNNAPTSLKNGADLVKQTARTIQLVGGWQPLKTAGAGFNLVRTFAEPALNIITAPIRLETSAIPITFLTATGLSASWLTGNGVKFDTFIAGRPGDETQDQLDKILNMVTGAKIHAISAGTKDTPGVSFAYTENDKILQFDMATKPGERGVAPMGTLTDTGFLARANALITGPFRALTASIKVGPNLRGSFTLNWLTGRTTVPVIQGGIKDGKLNADTGVQTGLGTLYLSSDFAVGKWKGSGGVFIAPGNIFPKWGTEGISLSPKLLPVDEFYSISANSSYDSSYPEIKWAMSTWDQVAQTLDPKVREHKKWIADLLQKLQSERGAVPAMADPIKK